MPFQPTVLHPLTLPALLDAILAAQHTPQASRTTLIVCSSREDFLQDLAQSARSHEDQESAEQRLQQLTAPTLRNLMTAKHVEVMFCPSVPVLLAYLTACSVQRDVSGEGSERRTLVLANPLSLHVPTPYFSAQGLSRTFAAAVETAIRVHARLFVVEAQGSHRKTGHGDAEDEVDAAMREADEAIPEKPETQGDPWEQEVPILNDSVRRLPSGGGERSWAGRTVKVNRVAARWFRFCRAERAGD
ncbi:uncharacterized protein EI97DRAFT_452303 [Westerdykella ornata]|uniref:Uncharacterized protein n=1 Tax=Westerdykella ornata TaxID=318751 RepID=A0A6A6JBA0_WESOR|nr:uncharacterized protein EI97DRAFT_452303 [Westerdykella ornata]KAF2273565.1 hypothetical protein EI97DRAFT_452303 [Westerdykella ornata]